MFGVFTMNAGQFVNEITCYSREIHVSDQSNTHRNLKSIVMSE